jgi:hypothetical protein
MTATTDYRDCRTAWMAVWERAIETRDTEAARRAAAELRRLGVTVPAADGGRDATDG